MSDTETKDQEIIDKLIKPSEARGVAALVKVGEGRGLTPSDLSQEYDFAKFMAQARVSLPEGIRGSIGDCLAVVDMALAWNMHPYQMAQLCYVVNGRLGFQGQLWHARLNTSGILQKRLRIRFDGEGEERVCIVTGFLRGEDDPHEYHSPPRGEIKPKNSPLWATDPDQQQSYLSMARWVRLCCPEIMLGGSMVEELRDMGNPTGGGVVIDQAGGSLRERLAAATTQAETEGRLMPDGFQEVEGEGDVTESIIGEEEEPKEEPKEAEPGVDIVAEEIAPAPAPAQEEDGSTKGRGRKRKAIEPKPEKGDKAAPPVKEARTETLTNPKDLPSKETVKAVADRAEKKTVPMTKLPTNVSGYVEHLKAWLASIATRAEIEEKWRAEMGLRNKCGVLSEERQQMVGLINERIKEL